MGLRFVGMWHLGRWVFEATTPRRHFHASTLSDYVLDADVDPSLYDLGAVHNL